MLSLYSLLTVFFYCFIGVAFIQYIYYFIFLCNFSLQKAKPGKLKKISISVIVCAKNEAENLKNFLPSIISQVYPNFEIVFVSTNKDLSVLLNKKLDLKTILFDKNDQTKLFFLDKLKTIEYLAHDNNSVSRVRLIIVLLASFINKHVAKDVFGRILVIPQVGGLKDFKLEEKLESIDSIVVDEDKYTEGLPNFLWNRDSFYKVNIMGKRHLTNYHKALHSYFEAKKKFNNLIDM